MGGSDKEDETNSYSCNKVTKLSDEERLAVLEKVKGLRSSLADRAQIIINDLMPKKILDLDRLFMSTTPVNLRNGSLEANKDTTFFSCSDLRHVRPVANNMTEVKMEISPEHTESKKRKLDSSVQEAQPEIPNNDVVENLLQILKMEVLQLMEYCNTVKIWIQLLIPRIEDGNNFGVSIQEETVNELSRAEDSGFTVLESITKYYVMRAKLVSKVLKYPTIKDYRLSIQELDEKEYINLRLCSMDLRNNYAILYDMINKNMEKIKVPRNSHGSTSMY